MKSIVAFVLVSLMLFLFVLIGNAQQIAVLNLPANQYGEATRGHNSFPLYLEAGQYTYELVSPDTNPEATYWAWQGWTGDQWRTACEIWDGATRIVIGGHDPAYTPSDAFWAAVNSGVSSATVQLTEPTTVNFGVSDNYIGDNLGGASILVSRIDDQQSPCIDPVRNYLTDEGFTIIQTAIDDPNAADYDTIQITAADFGEDVFYDRDIILTLSGGWYCDFSDNPFTSSLNSMTISSGTAKVENIVIKPSPLQEGLVAYYPFRGDATDASGNGNDGAVYGAALTQDRFGSPDSAYSFDGNARIDVPDDPSFSLGSEPFTIATWMQFSQLGSYYLMGHDEGENNRNKWILWVHSSGLLFHVNSPSTGGYDPVSYNGWVPEVGRWYFLVVKREGNDFMLYTDGSLVATGYDTRPIPNPATTFQMGTAEPGHPERVFRGLIDDVRIYSRALSDSEIQTLFNQ